MFPAILSPAFLLLTLPGDILETKPSLLATERPVTMQLVQRLPQSRHSSKNPPPLHPAILQATLEDTYIDDGRVGANSVEELSALQDGIGTILSKGGFRIKSWECSRKNSTSKYLGMTWDQLKDHYLLKFRLNLHKKSRGIPSGADLDSEFLQDQKNVLSVACQIYNPTGLGAPLMFSIRALFSEICQDTQCSINSVLSEEHTNRFGSTVSKILLTREISFPCQIIFNYSAQLYIFKDMGLVFMLASMVSSTLSPVQPKYWEKPHSLLLSLR